LVAARSNDSWAALKHLAIAKQVDLTEEDSFWSPLHYAALHGDTKLMDGLILHGAHSAYIRACEYHRTRATSNSSSAMSLDFFASEASDEKLLMNTPLHWSCFKGHIQTTLSLLDAGYSLGDLDSVGNTALHLAVASTKVAVVELCLASGADPLARNRYEFTPLDMATNSDIRSALSQAQSRRRPILAHDAAAEASRTLRMVASTLSDFIAYPPPTTGEEEEERVRSLERAIASAEATNGVVDTELIHNAEALIRRLKLSSRLRVALATVLASRPVVTQRAYADVNKLDKLIKAGESLGIGIDLITSARAAISTSFSEFWLFKIQEELRVFECASPSLGARISLLEARIAAATANGASESLVMSATKVLDKFLSEGVLSQKIDSIPAYKLPPTPEATAELNKKQLAAFLESYWSPNDIGHIKETTEADGCAAYPLPPGFNKSEEDESWAKNPLKALVNTREGYIWVPAMSLVTLREAAREIDIAVTRATNSEAFAPLIAKSRERLQKLEADIQQLELKDEADMALAEAAASKAAKKLKVKKK
jgi:hypothetical protein